MDFQRCVFWMSLYSWASVRARFCSALPSSTALSMMVVTPFLPFPFAPVPPLISSAIVSPRFLGSLELDVRVALLEFVFAAFGPLEQFHCVDVDLAFGIHPNP